MFGLEKMFGSGKEQPQNSPEETAELINKGISPDTAPFAVEDIASVQEKTRSEDDRFDAMVAAIKEIALEERIPAEDMLGRETMYANKLVEKGVLKDADLGFSGVLAAVKDAARQATKERIEQMNAVGRRREAQGQ